MLPGALPPVGTLYIAPLLGPTRGHLRAFFSESGFRYSQPEPDILAVPLDPERVEQLATGLSSHLSEAELQHSRSLVLPHGASPSLADLMRTQPLSAFVAGVEGRWLVETLAENRIVTFFQPIVHCATPESVFAYECLTRARQPGGELIYPDRLFGTARRAQLLFHLDRATRLAAIHGASHHRLETPIFINFNPTSVYDPDFCLRSTVEAVEEAGIAPESIVFEVVESEEIRDVEHLIRILEFYRSAGFRVALDDLGAGYGSLSLLTRLHPDFVKIDMELIRGVDSDPYRAQIASKLLELARDLKTCTVAEGVETEAEWNWCREHGADYAQGYLFGRPACPPSQPACLRAA